MTVPALRKRIPLSSVTELAKSLPFTDLLDWISAFKPDHVRAPQAEASASLSDNASKAAEALSQPYLLSNLLAFGSQRVAFIKDGAGLAKYLEALTNAQNCLPSTSFEHPIGTSNQAINGVATKSSQVRLASTEIQAESIETYERLRILVSDSHLSSILATSTRNPTSTRGPLFAFICATISAWPTDERDQVLNRLLYSGAESQASSQRSNLALVVPPAPGSFASFGVDTCGYQSGTHARFGPH